MSRALTKEEAKTLAAKAYADPVFFCKFFLPHLFTKEIPWVHRGMLAALTGKVGFLQQDPELEKIVENFTWKDGDGQEHQLFTRDVGRILLTPCRYLLLMLPRGFAKTTIAGVAVPLYEMLYHDCPFTVYISEASPHAQMQLTNVKREIEGNARIQSVFGQLAPTLKEPEKWSENFIETRTGMAVAARGRGGQIRGLNHRGNRPNKIIFDDVEDKESVGTTAQRMKTREWFYGDVIPALPELKDGRLIGCGTLLNADALLEVLARDPSFAVIRFGAFDKSGELLWSENMNREKLEEKKLSYARAGLLHVFYMEYFNEARAPEDQLFRQEFFKYETPPATEDLVCATYIDPAISAKRKADHCVICTWGITAGGKLWKLDQWGGVGKTPRDMIEEYFRQSRAWKSRRHGVESNSFQAALVHIFTEEMFRKRHYFEIEAITHKTKKEDRIIGVLVPRYSSDYIRHARVFPESETQAIDFRRGVEQKDDYLDADAACIALLDHHAALASSGDPAADEYAPLKQRSYRWAS